MMRTLLDSLRQHTTVVADTGNFETMQAFRPTDATTNPSLILKAVQQANYSHLLDEVIQAHPDASISETSDLLLVAFGKEILRIVPGRVSTEVDARLSFDTAGSIERARQIIDLYKQSGVDPKRILIKLASTWEGIQAARALQQEGINCNLTLLFSLTQAIACAQAKVTLISPFVGRIYDWYKKTAGEHWVQADNMGDKDPGVQSVRAIYNYYKTYDINTEIMGASFRNTDQILALAGCDLLTISPELLAQLAEQKGEVTAALSVEQAKAIAPEWRASNEVAFRTELNADAMATEKLAEGIRLFTADAIKLDSLIQQARQK